MKMRSVGYGTRRVACSVAALATACLTAGPAWGENFDMAGHNVVTIPTSQGMEHLAIIGNGQEGKLRCIQVDEKGRPLDRQKFHMGGDNGGRLIVDIRPAVYVQSDNAAKLQKLVGNQATIGVVPMADDWYELKTANALKAVQLLDLFDMRVVGSHFVGTSRPFSTRCEETSDEPLFDGLWHLTNTINTGADIRAEGAWGLGFTGKGVTIGIVDGGFDEMHPDLASNYSFYGSLPSQTSVSFHGTGVAGLAAAAKNCVGVVGLAHDASISSLYYGGSEYQAAIALFWANDINDVKCNSWGPLDNGRVTVISELERIAIEEGVRTGRGGLGEIYVWASGNGGQFDRMDYDPYASARETISVGWIGHEDVQASGNEQGAALMCVAHGGGNGATLTTTSSYGDGYTSNFQGSSAAAPLAAGAVALMLEANPSLTWRDVQHVLVNSARRNDPGNPSWEKNGFGHDISYDYGFGAIDARNSALLADCWINVGPEQVVEYIDSLEGPIPDNNVGGFRRDLHVTERLRVEHVELELEIDHEYRGDLVITLTSPSGTVSKFTELRNDPGNHFDNVVFTTVRSWDEPAWGDWRLRIADRAAGDAGDVKSWTLRVYGQEFVPFCPHDSNGDRVINFHDLNLVIDHFGFTDVPEGFCGDIDGNRVVNISDLNLLLEIWSQDCPE